MFSVTKGLRKISSFNLLQKSKVLFSQVKPKFVPKNNSGKIIGGSVLATALLCGGIYKNFSGSDEFYNEDELKKKGIFIEDQKLISENKSALDAKLSLQVKQWELVSSNNEKISSQQLKEKYYFVLLGHNQAMIDKMQKIFKEIHLLVDTKYYLSPELESYKQDIATPILFSIDAQNTPLQTTSNTLLLNGDQQSINKGFGDLFIKNYQNRLFLVDGLNGSTVSINIKGDDNEKLVGMFILNYLNEASIFRRFLQ